MYILVYICVCFLTKQCDPSHYVNTHPHSILQVPTTQLAKMSIDPKSVELTADVLEIFSSGIGSFFHLYNGVTRADID